MAKAKWIARLQAKWNLKSGWQVLIILVVFACTGFTVLLIKRPLLQLLTGAETDSILASVLYYIFILPIYNIVLLGYGFVFGQFDFFWAFEKRFFNRIVSMFRKDK